MNIPEYFESLQQPILTDEIRLAIRKLRAWHYQQFMLYQSRSDSVFIDLRQANIGQATVHIKAVDTLNDLVDGTAEEDLENGIFND